LLEPRPPASLWPAPLALQPVVQACLLLPSEPAWQAFALQAWPEPVLRAPTWQAFAPQVWPEPVPQVSLVFAVLVLPESVPPVLQEMQHPVLKSWAFPACPAVAPLDQLARLRCFR
jgi:hypothetical protein